MKVWFTNPASQIFISKQSNEIRRNTSDLCWDKLLFSKYRNDSIGDSLRIRRFLAFLWPHFVYIEVILIIILLSNSTKKAAKWKKHSVLLIFPLPAFGKNWSSCDFSVSPSYLSRKKLKKHFSARRCLASKTFFLVFSYFGKTLGKH